MHNDTSRTKLNSFEIDSAVDKRYVGDFASRNVIGLTLNDTRSDINLITAYETFLIRCLYFTGGDYSLALTIPDLTEVSKRSLLVNYTKRLIGRLPSFLTEEFIKNTEYLANLRQYHQNARICGSKINLKLQARDIEILSSVVNVIGQLPLHQSASNLWSVASWIGHTKYFSELYSKEIPEEVRYRINVCFSELVSSLVALSKNPLPNHLSQYIGSFMKIGLVITPKNENECAQLDEVDSEFLMDLIRLKSDDACVFFNKIYMSALFNLPTRCSTSEWQEIKDSILEEAKSFSKNIGGYSFYTDRSQDRYLSHRIKSFSKVPDLHGTAMLLWAESIYSHGLTRDSIYKDVYNVYAH